MIDDVTNKQGTPNERVPFINLNQILDYLPYGIRIIDRKCVILRVNAAFAQFLNVVPDDIVGKYCWDVFPNHLCHTNECCIKRIINGEDTVQFKVDYRKDNGIIVPCIITAFPVYDQSGTLDGIVEYFRDIVDQKHSEERYRNLFENVPVAIWEMDYSAFKNYVVSLKNNGITDIADYFNKNTRALISAYSLFKTIGVK
jgi:PAS domain S-box-containing protein